MPTPLDLERVRSGLAKGTPAIEVLIDHAREMHSGTELHRISDEAENELHILRSDLPAAVEEIAELRKAIQWYADERNYPTKHPVIAGSGDYAPVNMDRGERARAALRNEQDRKP